MTFRYKQADEEGSNPIQFGLIAEEVAETFPELVVYDEQGKAETVSYHLLATMLLNELQKRHTLMQAQAARVAALEQQSTELAQLKSKFGERLPEARGAMEKLARSQGPEALAKKAFQLYEAFRPEIPEGERGWGAKGKLSLKKIQGLAASS